MSLRMAITLCLGLLLFHTLCPSCVATNPMCTFSDYESDYCDLEGDVRVHGNSSTIFVVSNDKTVLGGTKNSSLRLKPYARKGDSHKQVLKDVREWTIKRVGDEENVPGCTQTHDAPAIIFSLSAYAHNLFHDFTDILIPLFAHTREFKREIHLLNTDYRPHWLLRFRTILKRLSRYPVVNIDLEKEIRCYRRVTVGLERNAELSLDPSRSRNNVTVTDFRRFLRSTYSLKRARAIKLRGNNRRRPRLMIISRALWRKWRKLNDTVEMAKGMGFDVVIAEANITVDVAKFARLVNSCDVLMGIHGAGLANLMFLPDGAVVIQVIPLGGIDIIAKMDYEDPTKRMKLRYLGYNIQINESSLIERYKPDDPVIKDPMSVLNKGWKQLQATYLDNQDVTLNLHRFRRTLLKALHFLRH